MNIDISQISENTEYPETARALAEKWGPVFGVEPGWVVSHCFVESTNKPLAHRKGSSAYGFMQLKAATASDLVRWMKKNSLTKDPRVSAVLKKSWRGNGEDLLNPELNVMLGTFYLGYLKKRFGDDHKIVSGAYNQGPKAMSDALKSGVFTKEMNIYIAKIEDAVSKGFA